MCLNTFFFSVSALNSEVKDIFCEGCVAEKDTVLNEFRNGWSVDCKIIEPPPAVVESASLTAFAVNENVFVVSTDLIPASESVRVVGTD